MSKTIISKTRGCVRKNTADLWTTLTRMILFLGLMGQSVFAEQTVSGITEPILDVTLSSPVSGIIGSRPVNEGDFVKEGQTVIELDKKLEELETSRRQVIVDKNKTDFEGTEILFKTTKSVSKDELDKKQADYRVSVAEHEIAEEQLRKRMIASPTAGYVTEIYREVGESCQANEKLVRIVDTRRCYFVCNVEAKTGSRFKVDQPVKLEVEAGQTSVALSGKVSFVSPVVDPASGLLKIKVVFENPDGKVRPGVAGKLFVEEDSRGS